MNAYFSLAPFYDELMRDADYPAWADYYVTLLKKHGAAAKTLLDLGCGTGTLAYLLADRGYELIGCDISPEMLSVAESKRRTFNGNPLFINQSMEDLDLYGTVGAAYCSLDSLNYVKPDKIGRVIERVSLFLEKRGVFIFDINTETKLRRMSGEAYVNETASAYCVWRAEFDETKGRAVFGMDIFCRDGARWRREQEEHVEYVHKPGMITELLKEHGFSGVSRYAELSLSPPRPDEERIFFVAIK